MKMASSTQLWDICAAASRYVFRWDRLLDERLAFVQAGVPSFLCANFKCDVANVHKQIRTDFRGVKCVSGKGYQLFRENSSWYIRSDFLVQQTFNQSPLQPIFNSLLALQPVNHRQQPVTSILSWTCCGLVSTVFPSKNIFSMYWSISFLN